MTKSDIIRKLTSRKLWMAVALFVSGLIVYFGGDKAEADTVAGLIMQGAAVVCYILAEGWTDASGKISTAGILPGLDPEILTTDQLRIVMKNAGYAYADDMTREELLEALAEDAE